MSLKVMKSDGSIEEYMHTKVLGTLNNALALIDQPNMFAAEQFAEAATFHLYKEKTTSAVTSEEIHLIIQTVLTATGYENAVDALNEYRLNRKLQRKRITVLTDDCESGFGLSTTESLWNKAHIVNDLVKTCGLDRKVARAIASSVEEKVFSIGITRIQGALVEHLVGHETKVMLQAKEDLQFAIS